MMRTRRSWLRWVVIALALSSVGALAVARSLRPVDVVATPIVRGHAVDAIYATGTVEAERRVVVKAKVAGPVVELRVREVDVVREGDLLARVDSPAAAFDLRRGQVEASAASAQAGSGAPRLASTRARIEALETQIAASKRELTRVKALVASGSLATTEEERARDHVTELEADRDALRADLNAQKIDLEASASRAQAIVGGLATRVSDTDVRATGRARRTASGLP